MYQRLLLDALAQAARGGEDHLARDALKGTDPLVRLWLRSRVAERIALASASVVDRTDRGHVLRLAFLQEGRLADDLDAENRETVRAAFDKASAAVVVEKKHRAWYTSMAVGLVAIGAGLVAFRITHPPTPFSPLSTPLGDALGPTLTSYVVAVHHEAQERRSGAAPDDEVDASHDAVLSKLDLALGLKSEPFARLLQRATRSSRSENVETPPRARRSNRRSSKPTRPSTPPTSLTSSTCSKMPPAYSSSLRTSPKSAR